MTDTAFAWTVAGIGSVLVLLILWVANRRRTDEPMWSPWDERLIAKGICPVHTPAKLGSEDCDSDCPPPREVVDAEMDALDSHIHHGTPDPALRAAEIAELGKVEASETTPDGLCCTDKARTAEHCLHGYFGKPERCPFAEQRWADPNAELTAPVEHASPRDRLRRIAAAHEQLGTGDLPQWADTEDHGPRIPSHWEQPAKPINGSTPTPKESPWH